ncbi:hypothetical protein HanHA89_Chr00c09g0742811 [Helianthus annuus]|nr:hypothetical protein HanHA89_Chr00c09g0742811 [Helianthus annuus]
MGHNINACINDAVQRDSFMVHLMPSRRHKTKETLIDRDNSVTSLGNTGNPQSA